VQIRKIAAPAARHQDFLADAIRSLEHDDAPAAPPGCDRAQKTGGAAADNDDIGMGHAGRITALFDTGQAWASVYLFL
jgi:hypothetical protein